MGKGRCAKFDGKVAIVTGGAGDIGKAISSRFAEEGASVCVADINGSGAEAVAKEIMQAGGKAMGFQVDITKESSVADMVKFVMEAYGRLDVLVNNAGAFVYGDLENVTEEDWDKCLGVNIKGCIFCTKHAVLAMKRRLSGDSPPQPNSRASLGAIVSISSIAGVAALRTTLPYATAKGAVLQFTRSVALDEGPFGIRVNAVCPGSIDTVATKQFAENVGITLEQAREGMLTKQMLKRVGHVDDVAAAVAFLASDEASFITGIHLMVDAGYTAQ